ncbi:MULTISPECIES: cupin domain-containing protein [Pseudoxanthomonas]|uniref:Mannose-6-phosphate isomerase-like protein (Cupin superfamily) n=1 Tax=Pseudoxanthomonas taiwanensis J19 TaxID=935569 RepID=A0A562DID5_9GAMM|nr:MULTISPECIES: cupin domain-containing protein [Pseudoxanthomonas]TWH09419.1 mannose-6-phosphate isomerase-like protein (cupin superfamily) [Pseudoxanthomonas taiwanensis J19]
MRHQRLRFGRGFRVLFEHRRVQAAQMVLAPGASEGGEGNRHRGADQWLYVVSGNGVAIVAGRRQRLAPGSLLLVERGEEHEIRNTGRTPLRTVNFYAPPAYTGAGKERPAGRPR